MENRLSLGSKRYEFKSHWELSFIFFLYVLFLAVVEMMTEVSRDKQLKLRK